MTPDPEKSPVRLLLAEDQVMIREALAALLSFEGDIEVVAQVGRGDEVLDAAQRTHPDVAVLGHRDARPGRAGRRRRAEEDPPGGQDRHLDHVRPSRVPAPRDGVGGVRVPGQGLPGRQADPDPDLAAAALAGGLNPLTPRERDVLAASADGGTIAEVARRLYLSEGTVRNYLSACIQKTGARNRAEALHIASERGWL